MDVRGRSRGQSVGVSVGVPVDVFVSVVLGASVDVSMDDCGFVAGAAGEIAGEIAEDLAVEIDTEIAMASAMGLHGVPLLAAAFRGSPWKVRGSSWSVRGYPWNAVDTAAECRGVPWILPWCSAKKTNNVHLSLASHATLKAATVSADSHQPSLCVRRGGGGTCFAAASRTTLAKDSAISEILLGWEGKEESLEKICSTTHCLQFPSNLDLCQ